MGDHCPVQEPPPRQGTGQAAGDAAGQAAGDAAGKGAGQAGGKGKRKQGKRKQGKCKQGKRKQVRGSDPDFWSLKGEYIIS